MSTDISSLLVMDTNIFLIPRTLHWKDRWYNLAKLAEWSYTTKKTHTSPPARWGLLDFIRAVLLILLLLLLLRLLLFLLLQFLLDHACINFHVHFRLANSSPISSPTSARSGHCWTSTAGFRSDYPWLDLNRQVLIAVGMVAEVVCFQPPGNNSLGSTVKASPNILFQSISIKILLSVKYECFCQAISLAP